MSLPIVGIDPGLAGGIALVGVDLTQVWKMPATEKDIWDLLNTLRSQADLAVIELVRSSPQMGVSSAFTFGRGLGGLRMALVGVGYRFEEIVPSKWQRTLGCLSGGDKNVTKKKAQELFPQVRVTHWNADALLIALYGQRFMFKEVGGV